MSYIWVLCSTSTTCLSFCMYYAAFLCLCNTMLSSDIELPVTLLFFFFCSVLKFTIQCLSWVWILPLLFFFSFLKKMSLGFWWKLHQTSGLLLLTKATFTILTLSINKHSEGDFPTSVSSFSILKFSSSRPCLLQMYDIGIHPDFSSFLIALILHVLLTLNSFHAYMLVLYWKEIFSSF